MNGLLIIDKPRGITSFGALRKVKGITKQKKCGHTGTLDPMATGVLTVMLGAATRFCELLPDHDKCYRATVRLGIVTDTLDITGTVLKEHPVTATAEDFRAVLSRYTGEIMQLPPMYSAVSVNGQRLYELARKGEEVERKPRPVTVYSLEPVSCNEAENEYTFDIHCSSGTYVRTLADDIGRELGCGAVLTELRRTRANGFGIETAVTLEELEKYAAEGRIGELLQPVDAPMSAYPEVTVSAAQAKRFGNGGELDTNRLGNPEFTGICRVYSPDRAFLGLGNIRDDGKLWPEKVYTGNTNE